MEEASTLQYSVFSTMGLQDTELSGFSITCLCKGCVFVGLILKEKGKKEDIIVYCCYTVSNNRNNLSCGHSRRLNVSVNCSKA